MHGRGGGRAPGGKRAGPTIYELHSHGKRRSAREIPRLVAEPATPLSEGCLLKPMDPEWLRRTIAAGAAIPRMSSSEAS